MARVINDPAVTIMPVNWTRPVTAPSSIGSVMYQSLVRAAALQEDALYQFAEFVYDAAASAATSQ
jgi:hypothetical protein